MSKFKIDVNHYQSEIYPVALYKWKPGRWFGGEWKHYESHKSRIEAQEHYERIKDNDSGLPIYLGVAK